MLLQHCSLKSRGCHPLIASSHARDRSVPGLRGSTLSMLRNYPGLAPFFWHLQGKSCDWEAGNALLAINCPQPSSGKAPVLRCRVPASIKTSRGRRLGSDFPSQPSQLTKLPRALPDPLAVAGLHVHPLKKGDDPKTTLASTRSGTSFGFLPVLC